MTAPVKPSPAPRRRGRPRSEAARKAILEAARAMLAEGGPAAVTMEGVAERAGVGKPTVYRWFPDRHALAMGALLDAEPQPATPAPAPGPRAPALEALESDLRAIVRRLATPTGRHVTTMIAASDPDSELARAFRNRFVLERRDRGRALLEEARRQGRLRPDLDPEVALDLLYGPLLFRLLLGHAPLDEAFVETLVSTVLRGLGRDGSDQGQAR